MTRTIIFEDGKGLLAPLNDLRPACCIRTGALTLLDRLDAQDFGALSLLTSPALAPLAREVCKLPVNEPIAGGQSSGDEDGACFAVNARTVLVPAGFAALKAGEAIVERDSRDVIVARLTPAQARDLTHAKEPAATLASLAIRAVEEVASPALLSRPWHVKTFRDRALAHDLQRLEKHLNAGAPTGVTSFGPRALRVMPSARILPGVVFDLEFGPIFVAEHAVIRPGAVLIGPCYVGPHSTVLDRAVIRAGTAIGPHCKVAGEVGGTIFQGFANKAHDGYLGDSWVGEWVNLGAGTTNSNLLNTYGEIIARALPEGATHGGLASKNERTGEQFLGTIIGDHVKTAIGTRIMTGSVLHTGSMFATTAPVSGCVARFTWATDAGRHPYRVDKFLEVMKAAMGRRKIVPSEANVERIVALSRGLNM